jgi:hypothetical protein
MPANKRLNAGKEKGNKKKFLVFVVLVDGFVLAAAIM